jgi:hypothetical protein
MQLYDIEKEGMVAVLILASADGRRQAHYDGGHLSHADMMLLYLTGTRTLVCLMWP